MENMDNVFSKYLENINYPKEKLEFYANEIPQSKISLVKALISYETKNFNATEDRCKYLFDYIVRTNDSSAFINVVFWAMQSDISIEKLDELINECETAYELITRIKENYNDSVSRFNGLIVEAELIEKKIAEHKKEFEQIKDSNEENNNNCNSSNIFLEEEIKQGLIDEILQIISESENKDKEPISTFNIDEFEEELTKKISSKIKEELPINLVDENEVEILKKELEEERGKRIQAENEANKYFKIICNSLNEENKDSSNVKEIFGSDINVKKLNTNIEPDTRKKIFNFKSDTTPIEMKITQLMIKRKYSADTISKVTFAVKSETVDKNVMFDMIQNSKNENELNTFLEMV